MPQVVAPLLKNNIVKYSNEMFLISKELPIFEKK